MLQVSQQEVTKTHYPYKEPRIDQRMYQADIPALRGGDSNRAVTRGSSSPRAGVCAKICRLCYVHKSRGALTELRRLQQYTCWST